MEILPISPSKLQVHLYPNDFPSSSSERLELILLILGLENTIYDLTPGSKINNDPFAQAHVLLTVALEALLWPILVEDSKFQAYALSRPLGILWATGPDKSSRYYISVRFGSSTTMVPTTYKNLINETRLYLDNSGLLTEFL